MMDGVLLLSMVYAAIGLGLSAVAHVLAVAGIEIGGTTLSWAMHAGIFPLWVPVALAGSKMSRRAPGKDHWEATMSGCPAWMRYMAQGFFFYSVVIFMSVALYMMIFPADARSGILLVRCAFSAVWMMFYSVGLAIVTSAFLQGLYP
jgi:hypothetical protein